MDGNLISKLQTMGSKMPDVEFGMKVFTGKTNPKLAGLVAHWGEDVPKGLPRKVSFRGAGVLHVSDPETGGVITTIRRTPHPDLKYSNQEPGTRDIKDVPSLFLPLKFRQRGAQPLAGAKSLQKLSDATFEHADKRGETLKTVAGAYEKGTAAKREKQTYGLTKAYYRRGFKVDPDAGDIWNINMTRKPGASRPAKPFISPEELHSKAVRSGDVYQSGEIRKIGKKFLPSGRTVAGGATVATAAGGLSYESNRTEDSGNRERLEKSSGAVLGAGAAVGGFKAVQALYASRTPAKHALATVAVRAARQVSEKWPKSRLAKELFKRVNPLNSTS